jgi:hypothetical protein
MPPGTRRAQGDAARACALKKRGAMTSRPGRMIRRRASEGGDRDSQVVTADHDGPLHLGRHNNTTQQLATDRHVARPGALLVDVATLLGVEGRLEAQTDRLGPTDSHTKSTRNTHLSDYTRARLHRRPPLQTSCCAWALARGVTGVRVFAAAPPPPPPGPSTISFRCRAKVLQSSPWRFNLQLVASGAPSAKKSLRAREDLSSFSPPKLATALDYVSRTSQPQLRRFAASQTPTRPQWDSQQNLRRYSLYELRRAVVHPLCNS